MARVLHCENSTIVEGYALAKGLPALFEKTAEAVLLHAAQRQFPGLQIKPSVVAIQLKRDQPTNPFWSKQVAWEDDRYLARFGHRYLSVHFVKGAGEPYSRFSDCLQPQLEAWLATYARAFDGEEQPASRLGFGYVNEFLFPSEDFDLSQFFKLSLDLEVGGGDVGLLRMDTGFEFLDEPSGMHVSLGLSADDPAENDEIRVVTRIVAEARDVGDVSLVDPGRLLEIIVKAKETAKARFFDFVTDETHKLMGAKYEEEA